MKIALLDFHRKKNHKIDETVKIKDALTVKESVHIDIFEMMEAITPQVPLAEYDSLVMSGSDSQHLEKYRGYRVAKKLVERAIADEKPVLGICAGHQILSTMLGHSIEFIEEGPEVGWYEIFLSEEGKKDPFFQGVPDTFASFLCHIKRVKLVESNNGLRILAQNGNCPQAFRFMHNCYSIQFHPEDTLEGGEDLIRRYKRRPPTEQHRLSSPASLPARRVFQNFIEIIESTLISSDKV